MIDSCYLNDLAKDNLVDYMREYLIKEKKLSPDQVDMLFLDDFLCPWNWGDTPVLKGDSLREMAENFIEKYLQEMVDYLESEIERLPGY